MLFKCRLHAPGAGHPKFEHSIDARFKPSLNLELICGGCFCWQCIEHIMNI